MLLLIDVARGKKDMSQYLNSSWINDDGVNT